MACISDDICLPIKGQSQRRNKQQPSEGALELLKSNKSFEQQKDVRTKQGCKSWLARILLITEPWRHQTPLHFLGHYIYMFCTSIQSTLTLLASLVLEAQRPL
jgi:hypothetical protein